MDTACNRYSSTKNIQNIFHNTRAVSAICQRDMRGNWDRASDDRDRWVDLRAEQCDFRPNKCWIEY